VSVREGVAWIHPRATREDEAGSRNCQGMTVSTTRIRVPTTRKWWQLEPPAVLPQLLPRGAAPSISGGSRNARFYWIISTSFSTGGEGGTLRQ